MLVRNRYLAFAGALALGFSLSALPPWPSYAQGDAARTAAASAATAPELKSADELEELVARIALYPDDLVAAIMASALYPLQIVQAARFLDQVKTKPDLKPDADWDGSVVSLLNYPQIVTMMNDDLSWTEALGEAVTNQQEDMLVAIQQLRDKAVADGAIKSDDKVIVETKNDNVVIRPAKEEVTYVPQYDPQILLEPDYVVTSPIIYGDPYPSYYYPYAPYWSGFIIGAVWGAAVDWDNWHSWGGDVDIDIDIDRDKFKFDRDKIGDLDWNRDRGDLNFDHNRIGNDIKANAGNRLDRKTNTEIKTPSRVAGRSEGIGGNDVRRDVAQGLKKSDGSPGITGKGPADGKQAIGGGDRRPDARPDRAPGPSSRSKVDKRPAQAAPKKPGPAHQAKAQRPKAKPAARVDSRPRQPSAMGDYGPGPSVRQASYRGQMSRGGGGRHGGGGGRGGGGRRR